MKKYPFEGDKSKVATPTPKLPTYLQQKKKRTLWIESIEIDDDNAADAECAHLSSY